LKTCWVVFYSGGGLGGKKGRSRNKYGVPDYPGELYERLITRDKIDLFLGPYESAVTDAVANGRRRLIGETQWQEYVSSEIC